MCFSGRKLICVRAKIYDSSNTVSQLRANRRLARDPQLTNSSANGQVPNLFEPTLPDCSEQQYLFRSNGREQIGRACQAAEALFTPKRKITEQPVLESSQVPKSRKPRVLPLTASVPISKIDVKAGPRTICHFG